MKEEIIKHLGGCKNKKCECDSLNDAFISLNSKEVFIIDEKDDFPIKLTSDDNLYHFKISNPLSKDFVVVKIDNCLISNDDERRSDGAVYNDKQFMFLEIKATKTNNKKTAKRTAYKQLEYMIDKFQNINFNNRELYAVIGFPTPKYSIVGAKSNAQKSRFKDDFKKKYGMSVNLMEGHEVILN